MMRQAIILLPFELKLYQFPGFLIDDGWVAVFRIILGQFAIVLGPFLCQITHNISFLKPEIPLVLLIGKDSLDVAGAPAFAAKGHQNFFFCACLLSDISLFVLLPYSPFHIIGLGLVFGLVKAVGETTSPKGSYFYTSLRSSRSVAKPAFSSFYSVAPSQGSTPFQSKSQKNTFSGVLSTFW